MFIARLSSFFSPKGLLQRTGPAACRKEQQEQAVAGEIQVTGVARRVDDPARELLPGLGGFKVRRRNGCQVGVYGDRASRLHSCAFNVFIPVPLFSFMIIILTPSTC